MQRGEQDGRLDVAGVIDGVDGGAMPLDVLRAFDAVADAAQRQPEPNTQTSDVVEDRRTADQQRDRHEWRADEST